MKSFGRFVVSLTLLLFVATFLVHARAGAAHRRDLATMAWTLGTGNLQRENLPEQWSANVNIKWKASIPGRGHSSPIVWGNRIFLTTAIEGEAGAGRQSREATWTVIRNISIQTAWAPIVSTSSKLSALIAAQAKLFGPRQPLKERPYDDRHRKSSLLRQRRLPTETMSTRSLDLKDCTRMT